MFISVGLILLSKTFRQLFHLLLNKCLPSLFLKFGSDSCLKFLSVILISTYWWNWYHGISSSILCVSIYNNFLLIFLRCKESTVVKFKFNFWIVNRCMPFYEAICKKKEHFLVLILYILLLKMPPETNIRRNC